MPYDFISLLSPLSLLSKTIIYSDYNHRESIIMQNCSIIVHQLFKIIKLSVLITNPLFSRIAYEKNFWRLSTLKITLPYSSLIPSSKWNMHLNLVPSLLDADTRKISTALKIKISSHSKNNSKGRRTPQFKLQKYCCI